MESDLMGSSSDGLNKPLQKMRSLNGYAECETIKYLLLLMCTLS